MCHILKIVIEYTPPASSIYILHIYLVFQINKSQIWWTFGVMVLFYNLMNTMIKFNIESNISIIKYSTPWKHLRRGLHQRPSVHTIFVTSTDEGRTFRACKQLMHSLWRPTLNVSLYAGIYHSYISFLKSVYQN